MMLSWTRKSESTSDLSRLDEKLIQAKKKGRSDIIGYLLEEGSSPNARDSNGYHVLHDAPLTCPEHGVPFLLEYGADPHPAPVREEQSPLEISLQYGKLPIAKLLLAKMVELGRIPDKPSPELLCTAAPNGMVDVARKLLARGADPNAEVEDFRVLNSYKPDIYCTTLRWATGYNHENMVKLLLDHGAKSTPQALIEALQDKSLPITELPLDAGLDPNKLSGGADIDVSGHYNTILQAVNSGQMSLVKMLHGRGQRLEIPPASRSPNRVLGCATRGGVQMLQLLFDSGFEVEPAGDDGAPDIDYSIRNDTVAVIDALKVHNVEALEFLFKKGVGLPPSQNLASHVDEMCGHAIYRPGHFHGSLESTKMMLDLLLEQGFDINKKSGTRTTLACAAQFGDGIQYSYSCEYSWTVGPTP
ncbi:ankyrin repeat-containing domain protein [Aspergillus insuetus]